jgi:hypothetical protein
LPDFISKARVFNLIKRIEKPFQHIGLPNMLETCNVKFDGNPALIGFTSANEQGLWDLTTMSMRGVMSCMHWSNHRHVPALIGSVTDPFLGMVYITDGTKTVYGPRITRRSLVRFVKNFDTDEYELVLERVYKDTGNKDPLVYDNRDIHEYDTLQVFVNFLKSKVAANVKVNERILRGRYSYGQIIFSQKIPASTSLDYVDVRSMSDCGIHYAPVFNDPFIAKFANQN